MMFVGRVPLKQIGKLLGVFALLIVFALVLVMAVGTDKEDNPPKQNLTEQNCRYRRKTPILAYSVSYFTVPIHGKHV